MVWKDVWANDESGRSTASRRNVLRKTGATGLALTGITSLSSQAAASTVTLNDMKTNSDSFDPRAYPPTGDSYTGGVSMTVNKREYETGPGFVNYQFDITGTFESTTHDDDPFVDTFGFRLYFDSDDGNPVATTHDPQDHRINTGIDLDGGSYNAQNGVDVEEGIEFALGTLVSTAGWVSSSYVTVGSLMWALFGDNVSLNVNNYNEEVRFNEWGGFLKEADLGYYSLDINLDPSQTNGVTFEVFNQTVASEVSVSRHFDLNDH